MWIAQERYETVFQAEYVSSEKCGECHFINHQAWEQSPHRNITREPNAETVKGNFNNAVYFSPNRNLIDENDSDKAQPLVKTFKRDDHFYMALKNADTEGYSEFKIDRVVGYQYRQTYLTRETDGVLRRLPVQWSVPRNEFFAYWNEQEQSPQTPDDLWAQMETLNSAWNLFCARCHTTNLDELFKDAAHTKASVEWTEPGVGCESCHGPGSAHVEYMEDKPINRLMSLFRIKAFGDPAPYIINVENHSQGVALSVCARCHGADIFRKRMAEYRNYEPGYNSQGKLNDLSAYFSEAPTEPGRTFPTLQVWPDGRPKGLGTLFRSFADSSHYQQTDMRCYTCHDPHNNKKAAEPGILFAGETSNNFCLECHQPIADKLDQHTRHQAGTAGSNCYDCHLPQKHFEPSLGCGLLCA